MIFEKVLVDIIFIAFGALIITANVTFISEMLPIISPIVNVIGGMIIVIPPFVFLYMRYKRARDVEEHFISFVNDLTSTIESGMTLPLALRHVSKRNYGYLSPYVKEVAAKVEWGIPFEKALEIMGKKTGNIVVKRAVATITESYRVGGKVTETLKAVGKSLIEIDKIKKERSASVHSQVVTSYLIFFVFIFILIVLQSFLIPALSVESGVSSITPKAKGSLTSDYRDIFMRFLVVQGFFAGLAIGKMAEGSIVAGLKHSIVLVIFGYTMFSIFSQFKISFLM